MHLEDNDGSEDRIRKEAKESRVQLRRTTTGWQLINTTDIHQKSRADPKDIARDN